MKDIKKEELTCTVSRKSIFTYSLRNKARKGKILPLLVRIYCNSHLYCILNKTLIATFLFFANYSKDKIQR